MKKRIICAMLVAVQLFFVHAQEFASTTDRSALLQQAVHEMEAYNYGQVIHLIPSDTQDSLLVDMRSRALMALSRYQEAIVMWNVLYGQDSTNVQVQVNLADCYRAMGNYPKASEYYGKAVEHHPTNTYFRTMHVRSLLNAAAYEEAVKASHAWLEQDSLSAEGYKYLGMAYEGKEDYMNAFMGYNLAYRRDSLDAQTVGHIANLFILNEQYQDAIDVTETYRQTDTTSLDVNRQNAKAYCMKKDYKTAIQRYESLKRMGDRTFTSYYYLGIAYFGDNLFYGAYENLKEANKMSPSDVNVLYYYGMSAAYTSWKQEGAEMLQKAIDVSIPADELLNKLYTGASFCYARAGDWEKAVDMLMKKYDLTKKNAVLYDIAQQYDWAKHPKEAVEYYERYMKGVPEDKRYILDENGNPDKSAMTRYQQAEKRIGKIKEELFFKGELKKTE